MANSLPRNQDDVDRSVDSLLLEMQSVPPLRRAVFDAPSMRRSSFGIRGWLLAAASHGVPAGALLVDTPLDADDLADGVLVTSNQELAVVKRLSAAVPKMAGVGVAAGSSCTVGSLGPYALACISATTVGDAFDVAVSLLDLTFAFISPVSWRDDRGQVVWMDDRLVPEEARCLIMERDLTAFLRVVPAITEWVDGIRVHTSLGDESIAELRKVAHGVLVTRGVANVIEIDSTVLSRPTRQANPDAAALWMRLAQAELLQRAMFESVTASIVAKVKQRLADPPTLTDLAQSFHIDERTLRRRLAKEGASYRRIVDEARHECAVELIAYGDDSVERIAARVGYNDAAAFSAAFKRWRGESPGRFRRRQLESKYVV